MSDHIDELCALVKSAGGTMRLYGHKVSPGELRSAMEARVDAKLGSVIGLPAPRLTATITPPTCKAGLGRVVVAGYTPPSPEPDPADEVPVRRQKPRGLSTCTRCGKHCSGGMAMGFRRAGIEFDIAVDFERDHCDSYEQNLGHRPEQLDVRVLLEQVRAGARRIDVDLLVADPPCAPWSRAGKRLGTRDERDMLEVTCDLIAVLRPRRYLIGNVPGLEDGVNLHVVHRTIGALAKHGYCVRDFLSLDAASYGVPQHRRRPFWFGHLEGPCLRPPVPTHCDPLDLATLPIPGIEARKPWVTCRDALAHLEPHELGRAVKMRRREQNGSQLGSVPDRPARVVGTSNLSDGNVLAMPSRHKRPVHTSEEDRPARSLTTQCRAPGHASTIVLNQRHAPADADAPAPTLGAKYRGQGAQVLSLAEPTSKHPAATPDAPAPTVRAVGGGHTGPHVLLAPESGRKKRPTSTKVPQSARTISPDAPSSTVQAREDRVGSGSPVLEWPWPRPTTTVTSRPGLAHPGHHDEDFAIMSLPDAVILSERAAAILQGFPDDGSWTFCGKTKKARWSAIGQAMPPALAHAVANSIREQNDAALREGEELRGQDSIPSSRDGATSSRQGVDLERGRPSQERRQARQPPRESRGNDPTGALSPPHAEASTAEAMRGVRRDLRSTAEPSTSGPLVQWTMQGDFAFGDPQ